MSSGGNLLMSDPTLYRMMPDPWRNVAVVPVLSVCPTCDGSLSKCCIQYCPVHRCPDCTPLADGTPSGVQLTYKDQP